MAARNLLGQPLVKNLHGSGWRTLGCSGCPMDGAKGVRKVKGLDRVTGRKAMLWAQNPGRTENQQGLELVGESGKLLWAALGDQRLGRGDFDIQNICRCICLDRDGNDFPPTKEILQACSVYNDAALERNAGRAVVHLILGDMAGNQLLRDAYRKDAAMVWYEPWGAYAVFAYHPSYLLRKGGRRAGWHYRVFEDRLRAVRATMDHPGRWGYLKSLDWGVADTPKAVRELAGHIRSEAAVGRLVSLDIETGIVGGKEVITLVGFGWGRRKGNGYAHEGARSVVLHHPEADPSPKRIGFVLQELKSVLEDPKIPKALQNGVFDVEKLRDLLGIRVRGFEYDTRYGTYLRHSHLRSVSLDSQVALFLPEFQDYKRIVDGYENYADVPLKELALYNCGDCLVTKRMELRIRDQISLPLLQVYIHDAFVLDAMEKRGPLLDRQAVARVLEVLPERVDALARKLRQVAGDRRDFNPNAPEDIAWLLYDHLGIPQLEGRGTGQDLLRTVMQQVGKRERAVIQNVLDYRFLSKAKGTYVDGFVKSADKHGGELRTVWWLTGAVTGRLRSGKSDKAEAEGVINFQNLHSNPVLQNLLVSDLDWRRALEEG